jgi:hypothetical protein
MSLKFLLLVSVFGIIMAQTFNRVQGVDETLDGFGGAIDGLIKIFNQVLKEIPELVYKLQNFNGSEQAMSDLIQEILDDLRQMISDINGILKNKTLKNVLGTLLIAFESILNGCLDQIQIIRDNLPLNSPVEIKKDVIKVQDLVEMIQKFLLSYRDVLKKVPALGKSLDLIENEVPGLVTGVFNGLMDGLCDIDDLLLLGHTLHS